MTKEEKSKLLISYKKSNKERRVKMLQKYNMSEATFLLFLLNDEITSESEIINKKRILYITILDLTGSMRSKWNGVVSGITESLNLLLKDALDNKEKVISELSVRGFYELDGYGKSKHLVEYNNYAKISEVNNQNIFAIINNIHEIKPTGSNTPLYLYLYNVLNDLILIQKSSHTYDSILINIFTDGEDNASQEYKNRAALTLKDAKEYNILTTFVATQFVIDNIIERLNISNDNTLVVKDTDEGYMKGMQVNSVARSNYTNKVVEDNVDLDGYFKDFKE